jgi:hypothetical protein
MGKVYEGFERSQPVPVEVFRSGIAASAGTDGPAGPGSGTFPGSALNSDED